MDREIELKFLIPPEAVPEVLAHLKGEGAVRQLDATYFDTADHRLRKAGFGLRVRDGEGGRKQTLKSASAGGVFSRGEWEERIVGPRPDIDALARTPAAALLCDQVLEPVFITRIERTVRLVQAGGATIEAALDRGELLAGARRAAVCELELELKSGPASALFDLAREVARHVPLRLSLVSKAERGYSLAVGGEATSQHRLAPALDPHATVGEALQALGHADLAHLCAVLETLRERPEPAGVHQARVATRRLRVLLKIFKPLAGDTAARLLDDGLDWLAGEFDQARDLDVFIGDAWGEAKIGLGFEDPEGFEHALQAAHAQAYLRVEAAMASPRTREVLLGAAAWLETGAWITDGDLATVRDSRADAFAATVLQHRLKRVKKGARIFDDLDAYARHRLRLKGKTLRYAAEDLCSLFPNGLNRVASFLEASRAVQDTLGALNDRHVHRGLIETVAEDSSAQVRDIARIALAGNEHGLLVAARKALDTLIDAEPFW